MRTSDGVAVVISGGGKVVGVECCGGNGMAAELGLRRGIAGDGEGFGGQEGAERGEGRGIYIGGVSLVEGAGRIPRSRGYGGGGGGSGVRRKKRKMRAGRSGSGPQRSAAQGERGGSGRPRRRGSGRARGCWASLARRWAEGERERES